MLLFRILMESRLFEMVYPVDFNTILHLLRANKRMITKQTGRNLQSQLCLSVVQIITETFLFGST